MACPCLCGHPMHLRFVDEVVRPVSMWDDGRRTRIEHDPCPVSGCGCRTSAPDYGARDLTDDVAEQLGATRPGSGRVPLERRVEVVCEYCLGSFRASRAHATTCCGACREAVSAALALEDDDDVPRPAVRLESWSRARQRATGFGLMTRAECYEADLRVRRARSRETREGVVRETCERRAGDPT